jgi:hypothetical protein
MTMNTKNTSQRIKECVDYLIGDGLFARVPERDTTFYVQAGMCSSDHWPTKLSGMQRQPVTKNNTSASCLALSSQDEINTQETSANKEAYDENKSTEGRSAALFLPKHKLPVPILRETYRIWKSSMNMGFRFRKLRQRKATIALQPLGEFPPFLHEFVLKSSESTSIGFFELLQEFLGAFLVGIDIKLLPPVDHTGWPVSSRIHATTGKQQVSKHYRCTFFRVSDGYLSNHLLSTLSYRI